MMDRPRETVTSSLPILAASPSASRDSDPLELLEPLEPLLRRIEFESSLPMDVSAIMSLIMASCIISNDRGVRAWEDERTRALKPWLSRTNSMVSLGNLVDAVTVVKWGFKSRVWMRLKMNLSLELSLNLSLFNLQRHATGRQDARWSRASHSAPKEDCGDAISRVHFSPV